MRTLFLTVAALAAGAHAKQLSAIVCPSAANQLAVPEIQPGASLSSACQDLKMSRMTKADEVNTQPIFELHFTTGTPSFELEGSITKVDSPPQADDKGMINLSTITVPENLPEGVFYLVASLKDAAGKVLDRQSYAMRVPTATVEGLDLMLDITRAEVTTQEVKAPMPVGTKNPLGQLGITSIKVKAANENSFKAKSYNSAPFVVVGVINFEGMGKDWEQLKTNQTVII